MGRIISLFYGAVFMVLFYFFMMHVNMMFLEAVEKLRF